MKTKLTRHEMISTLRGMGWRPYGEKTSYGFMGVWKCLQKGSARGDGWDTLSSYMSVFRRRQETGILTHDALGNENADTVEIAEYEIEREPLTCPWAYLCDDEVLRFYLKIMMEGL